MEVAVAKNNFLQSVFVSLPSKKQFSSELLSSWHDISLGNWQCALLCGLSRVTRALLLQSNLAVQFFIGDFCMSTTKEMVFSLYLFGGKNVTDHNEIFFKMLFFQKVKIMAVKKIWTKHKHIHIFISFHVFQIVPTQAHRGPQCNTVDNWNTIKQT